MLTASVESIRRIGSRTDTDRSVLCSQDRLRCESRLTPIFVVDLSSGCGGLTIGVLGGARRAVRAGFLVVAIDIDVAPLELLEHSLGEAGGDTGVTDFGDALGRSGSRSRRREFGSVAAQDDG